MGDRVTQGTLARGMSKLDARRARARPRGPSALPSNHEIVSYGCEVPLHAYKLMAIPLATRTCNSSKLRAKLGRRRATIRGFLVASSLLVSTVSVVPYSHARENAPSLTQLFVSKPQSDFLGSKRAQRSRGAARGPGMSSPGSSPAPPKAAHTIRTSTPGTCTRRVTRRTKTN